MASNQTSNSKLQQQLKDITKCCICRETFKDPRILPCVHTFCRKCLEEVGSKSNKKSGQNMPCPLCKRDFAIPSEGFTALQKNLFLARHAEIGVSVSSPSSIPFCGACLEDGNNPYSGTQTPSADMFCAVCCITMCENCLKIHRKSKVTASHKLKTVEIQSIPGQNQSKLIPEFCIKHENELLKMYCSDCKKVVCSFCFIERHQRHKWSDVRKASGEFCSKIQDHAQSVAFKNKGLQMKKEKVSQAKLDEIANLESLKLEINQRKTLLKEIIDKHANVLLAKIDELHQEKLKLFETEEEDIDMQIANEEYYALYCQEITAKGSAGDICRDEAQLSRIAAELQDMNDTINQRHLKTTHTVLQISNLNEFMKENGRNFVGEITGSTLSTEASESQLSLPSLDATINLFSESDTSEDEMNETLVKYELDAFEDSRSKVVLTNIQRITGMAIIESELFLTNEMCPTVQVYNSVEFNRLRCWSVSRLTKPEDMVASLSPKCLYIFNAIGEGKIYQVTINGLTISSWFIGSAQVRLSVAPDSNIVVTYLGEMRLKEYRSTVKDRLKQQLSLQGSSTHTVKLKTGKFVVSRGTSIDNVFEIDAHGKDINSFKGNARSTSERLKSPEQVAVDKHGSVFVLDRGNRRVVLLDSKLVFQKELLSAIHGLRDPRAMVLDDTTNRLFVSDYDSAEYIWQIFVTDIAFL